MKKFNCIFMGTPDFSVASLEVLHTHPLINLELVISMPDRPFGRGHQLKSPEVIEFAKKNNINFLQTSNINKEKDFIAKYSNQKIDFIIVLAFAQFLGSKILNLPKIGCFNIHTSLLPKYRGAAPIQYALLNGDTKTGVSIQKMVKEMDAGDIVYEFPVEILPNDNSASLFSRLKEYSAVALKNFLDILIADKIQFKKQEGEITFAPTINKEDGYIDFKTHTFFQLKNKLRAYDPWPGCFFGLNNKSVKIIKICEYTDTSLKPGLIKNDKGKIIIGLIDKTIRLTELQMPGKAATTDSNFLNGFREELTLTGKIV